MKTMTQYQLNSAPMLEKEKAENLGKLFQHPIVYLMYLLLAHPS